MPRTESNSIGLGTPLPEFALAGPNGLDVGPHSVETKPALLVAFISNRCPFVVLIREELARIGRAYADRGLAVIAINANDAGAHPEESADRVADEAVEQGYPFPYVKDGDQTVARAFGAACTPDLFLYGPDRRLAYHGQFDEARPGNGKPVTGADLRAAIEAVLAGRPVAAAQVPSIGCNIKWFEGTSPARETALA